MYNFISIAGTNSKESTNKQLCQYMAKHFKDEADIELVDISEFPLFNKPAGKVVPDSVKALAKRIEDSDGVIISTPEYDHSVPAVLSNALAWLSYGIYPFVDKPVMITGASYGSLGSSRAQAHLRQILDAPELRARIMPSSEYLLGHSLVAFDEDNNLKDKDQVEVLNNLFNDFLKFVDINKELVNNKELNKKNASEFSWDKI